MRQVIYCGQNSIGGLTIWGKIASTGVDAMVDTEASTTVISPVNVNSLLSGEEKGIR